MVILSRGEGGVTGSLTILAILALGAQRLLRRAAAERRDGHGVAKSGEELHKQTVRRAENRSEKAHHLNKRSWPSQVD